MQGRYRIFYKILAGKEVVIVRVIHGSRMLDIEDFTEQPE